MSHIFPRDPIPEPEDRISLTKPDGTGKSIEELVVEASERRQARMKKQEDKLNGRTPEGH